MKLDRKRLYPWLAILHAKFMGSSRAMKLQEHFGSIEKALNAPISAIEHIPGFSREIGASIQDAAKGKYDREIDREMAWAEKHGIAMILHSDPEYPPPLRHIPASPALLFVKGNIRIQDILSVAIVGSRTASDSGRRLTNKIAGDLADAGLTIISGLAWGIDASAHKGALRCKQGRTIAVMGNGLKFVYPKEHESLADQIVKRGALVTELFYDVSPQGRNFPPRNRIISGLSLGVLIAEAPRRSGSLITADYALEQGKEIFALPGNVEQCVSPGTNHLIKNSRATLVTSAEDILKELEDKITFYRNELDGKIPQIDLGPQRKDEPNAEPAQSSENVIEISTIKKEEPPKPETSQPPLSEDEEEVFKIITEETQHIDIICRNLEWPVARVSSVLGLLELKGIIERDAGMRFRLADQ
jgi:DNA processing protein